MTSSLAHTSRALSSTLVVASLIAASGRGEAAVADRLAAQSQGVTRGSAADTAPQSGSVFVGCGFLLVENHGSASFTALLRSPKARQLPRTDASLFVLDDVLVEFVTTNARAIGAPRARGEELLRKHMAWEAKATAQRRGWSRVEPSGRVSDLKPAGATAMVWGYDAPKPFQVFGETIARILYVTAAIDDQVFVMSAPMRASDDAGHVARVLRSVLTTLARTGRPLDLHAFSNEVQASAGSWKGCAAAGTQGPAK